MPIKVRTAPENVTTDDCEKMMRELESQGSGEADSPPARDRFGAPCSYRSVPAWAGRLSHSPHGEATVQMEETRETCEQIERDHQDRMLCDRVPAQSPEGEAAAADVATFAGGGATLMIAEA